MLGLQARPLPGGQESSRGHRISNWAKGEGCWEGEVEGGGGARSTAPGPGWGTQVVMDGLRGSDILAESWAMG